MRKARTRGGSNRAKFGGKRKYVYLTAPPSTTVASWGPVLGSAARDTPLTQAHPSTCYLHEAFDQHHRMCGEKGQSGRPPLRTTVMSRGV